MAKKTLFGQNFEGQVSPKDFVRILTCLRKDESCYLSKSCDSCNEKAEALQEAMVDIFERLEVEEVEFEQWSSKDWSQMHAYTLPADSFCEKIINDMIQYKKHRYVSIKQSVFKKDLTENLPPNNFLIQMDFAENFNFTSQHAVQANYFKKINVQYLQLFVISMTLATDIKSQ